MATTWDPSDKAADVTLTNGNLTAEVLPAAWNGVRSTISKSTGKWYWEVTVDNPVVRTDIFVGIATISETLTYPGDSAEGYGYYSWDGTIHNGGSAGYGDQWLSGDIISVALDMDGGKIWWAKNGTWQSSGDPSAGTNEAYSGITGTYFAMVGLHGNTDPKITVNFGPSSFTYPVPDGFNSGLFDYFGQFTGYTYEQGSPVSRSLYLYRRDTGAYVDTTTSSGDGAYALDTTYSGTHFIVCLDDAAGDDFNDLIIGNVIPTTVSG